MRRGPLAVLLVVVWVLLWDRLTIGQLLAGIFVAAVLLAVLRPAEGNAQVVIPFRPLALVRLGSWFARQFVASNVQVARASLFPGRYVRPGIIRVPLRVDSPQLAALVANITALSPGMQPVGGTDAPPSIDVHILSLESEEAAAAIVRKLEDLVLAAFGPAHAEVAP